MAIVPTIALLSRSTPFLTASPPDSDGTCLAPSAQIPLLRVPFMQHITRQVLL